MKLQGVIKLDIKAKLTFLSPVHTSCECEANLTWTWRHNPPFVAILASELSKVELPRTIHCEFVTSTYISHLHSQEVWTGLYSFLITVFKILSKLTHYFLMTSLEYKEWIPEAQHHPSVTSKQQGEHFTHKHTSKIMATQWSSWLEGRTCNHKVTGLNPIKLTADFTMTRILILSSSYWNKSM